MADLYRSRGPPPDRVRAGAEGAGPSVRPRNPSSDLDHGTFRTPGANLMATPGHAMVTPGAPP